MKATLFLRKDHENIRALFSEYRQAKGTDGKRVVFERIRKELVVHLQIETDLLFPELEESAKVESEELITSALQEDRRIKKMLSDISTSETDRQLDSKIAGLIENVNRHIDEEEELFEQIRRNLSEQRLEELGLEMEERKRMLTQIAA